MLNRLFQATIITLLLSLMVGSQSLKISHTSTNVTDSPLKFARNSLMHVFTWSQQR
jgi:hypothetical protein